MLPKQSQMYRKIAILFIAIAKMRGANFISEGKIEILKSLLIRFLACVLLIFSPPILRYPSVINWLLPRGGDQMDWDNYHRLDTIHNWMDRYPPQPPSPLAHCCMYYIFVTWMLHSEYRGPNANDRDSLVGQLTTSPSSSLALYPIVQCNEWISIRA